MACGTSAAGKFVSDLLPVGRDRGDDAVGLFGVPRQLVDGDRTAVESGGGAILARVEWS